MSIPYGVLNCPRAVDTPDQTLRPWATGRVTRCETDRSVVLLIDARFAEPRYRRLFPAWCQPVRVKTCKEIGGALRRFWQPGK